MAQTTVLSFLIASPENGTVIQLECTTKDWYLDFEDAAFITTLEATYTKNGWESFCFFAALFGGGSDGGSGGGGFSSPRQPTHTHTHTPG